MYIVHEQVQGCILFMNRFRGCILFMNRCRGVYCLSTGSGVYIVYEQVQGCILLKVYERIQGVINCFTVSFMQFPPFMYAVCRKHASVRAD